jgi:asparagine synthase (glutamine-hydrolysing)
VAHYLLMQQARELGITVVLSGQGADELLCGYFKFTGFYLEQLVREGRLANAARLLAGFARRGTVLRQVEFSETRRYLHRWSTRSGSIFVVLCSGQPTARS